MGGFVASRGQRPRGVFGPFPRALRPRPPCLPAGLCATLSPGPTVRGAQAAPNSRPDPPPPALVRALPLPSLLRSLISSLSLSRRRGTCRPRPMQALRRAGAGFPAPAREREVSRHQLVLMPLSTPCAANRPTGRFPRRQSDAEYVTVSKSSRNSVKACWLPTTSPGLVAQLSPLPRVPGGSHRWEKAHTALPPPLRCGHRLNRPLILQPCPTVLIDP